MLGKDDIETAAKAPTITAAVTILRMRGIAASFGFPLPGNADITRDMLGRSPANVPAITHG
jgi:hypothetical protein